MEDEEVLNRVVREARNSSAPIAPKIEDAGKRKERKERRKDRTSSRRPTEGSAAAAAPPATSATKAERRSRSRRRRRREAAAAPATVAAPAGEAENGHDDGRKVVLTPNVQFLRDTYHGPKDGYPETAGSPSKWHFRAEPLSPMSAPPQGSVAPGAPHRPAGEYGAGMPPLHHAVPYGMAPGMPPPRAAGAPAVMARPMKTIAPKKWKVARANTIVKETEQLNSAEVRVLNEGEIVEQVAPALTLSGGIVRVLIRHPSSPQFPNPIGWVTSDATAAGGPKFLEPGPEPMSRGKPWAPPAGTRAAADLQPWRAPAVSSAPFTPGPAAPRPAAAVPAAQYGPKGYQNLVWTPSAS